MTPPWSAEEGYNPELVVVGSSSKDIVPELMSVLLKPLISDGCSRHRQLLLVDTGWEREATVTTILAVT